MQNSRRIIFYNNLNDDKFQRLMRKELRKMKDTNLDYVIFRNSNLLVPKMSRDGKIISGVDNIKTELKMILA